MEEKPNAETNSPNTIDENVPLGNAKHIINHPLEDEMKKSYLDYAMSVIVSRALPDIKDGLKPVHRRILFAMHSLGITRNKPHKKSARIVGEVIGKYHPHGDTAVYDTLVRLAQDFSLRYPLIDGQGNFGSVDGDNAAAMRYCVTGDTLIQTNKGLLPIESISKQKEEPISLKINSYNGKKNAATKFFNSGKQHIYEVTTKNGYSLKGSSNHPILCWEKDMFGIPRITWKLLENIDKNDVVILSRHKGLFSDTNYSFTHKSKKCTLDKNLAFSLGALVAEGSFHQNKIIFSNQDLAYYEKVKKGLQKAFPDAKFYERTIKGNCKEFDMYVQSISNTLQKIGLVNVKSDKKEIPFCILQSKKPIIAAFLQGLYEGDGSIVVQNDKRHSGQSSQLSYTSKSKKLISQIKILLLLFGIATTKPTADKRNDCNKIHISGSNNIQLFKDEIGFFSKRKGDILHSVKKSTRLSKHDYIPLLSEYVRENYSQSFLKRNNFDRYSHLEKNVNKIKNSITQSDFQIIEFLLKHNFFFDTIQAITITKPQTVYSIKVDSKCHSFIGNGFINHNTEARMEKIADSILADIEKETVDFTENFDGEEKEPVVLPTKLPLLLINGSVGIAVGMATNIPPHNLNEICKATQLLVKDPETTDEELLTQVTGPDFPTGGIIQGLGGIKLAYKTGRGKIKVRAKTHIEETAKRNAIILDEIPYQVNKADLVIEIANHVKNKTIEGISDIRDESDREGMRVVIEVKKDANTDVILNQLFKHTRCQTTFGINLLCLDEGIPKTLPLKDILTKFISHRKDVVVRRTQFDLTKAEKQAHILLGLKVAIENLDKTVEIVKKAESAKIAKEQLITVYTIDEIQAQAILDMKLQRLTGLERDKIVNDYNELMKKIESLKEILDSEKMQYDIIHTELEEEVSKFGDERKTMLVDAPEGDSDINLEDLITPEECAVTVTHTGYIKRLPLDTYRAQGRGGKGIIGTGTKDEDFVENIFVANTHSYLLCFTNFGQVHWIKVYTIPEGSRQAKGKAIINLVPIDTNKGEAVTTIIPVREFKEGHYLLLATKKGIVKKSNLLDYSKPRKGGVRGVTLDEGDELTHALLTSGEDDVMLATSAGLASRFSEKDVRSAGRATRGMKGITLENGATVIGAILGKKGDNILTITKNGFGKRTPIEDYRLIRRGGKGVINIQTSTRNGDVVGVLRVQDDHEILLISKKGIVIRTRAADISVIGRNTQGVRIMKLAEDDEVMSVTKIAFEEEK